MTCYDYVHMVWSVLADESGWMIFGAVVVWALTGFGVALWYEHRYPLRYERFLRDGPRDGMQPKPGNWRMWRIRKRAEKGAIK